MAQATTQRVNDDRIIRQDIPELSDNYEITARAEGETFAGSVTRIDTYGDTTDVERVVQFNMSFKHHIDGPDWVPWKAYLVEEPTGCYRINVILYNGSRSRTRNLDAPDDIDVTQ
jgi:hypothetical protein